MYDYIIKIDTYSKFSATIVLNVVIDLMWPETLPFITRETIRRDVNSGAFAARKRDVRLTIKNNMLMEIEMPVARNETTISFQRFISTMSKKGVSMETLHLLYKQSRA